MNKFMLALVLGLWMRASGTAQVLYGATAGNNAAGSLYTINTSTGAGTLVGPLRDVSSNVYAVTAMAFHPNGTLYAFTSVRSGTRPTALITINPSTGLVTTVGSSQSGTIFALPDMTILSNGQAYGWADSPDKMVTINLSTGAVTVVGPGFGSYGSGFAASAAGTLYLTPLGDTGELRTVDPATGVTTDLGSLTGGPGFSDGIAGLAFSPSGTLFGVINAPRASSRSNTLITINTTTRVITQIGTTVADLDAIAFSASASAPAASGAPISPVVLLFTAIGLVCLARYMLRRTSAAPSGR